MSCESYKTWHNKFLSPWLFSNNISLKCGAGLTISSSTFDLIIFHFESHLVNNAPLSERTRNLTFHENRNYKASNVYKFSTDWNFKLKSNLREWFTVYTHEVSWFFTKKSVSIWWTHTQRLLTQDIFVSKDSRVLSDDTYGLNTRTKIMSKIISYNSLRIKIVAN